MRHQITLIGAVVALSVYAGVPAQGEPLQLVESFAAPGNAVQMEYAPDYGLLFLRNSGSAVHVVDVATQSQIDLRMAGRTFTDFDLTPDQRYLYVADYGGTRIGYGNPSNPSVIHRYDLATRTWDTRTAPWVAYRIEGVSGSRYLVQEIDQHVDMMLNSWGPTTSEEVDRISADYYGDFEYDHRTGRIYHGSSGSSSDEIHARRLVGDNLINAGSTGVYGTAQGAGGTCVLSTDGSRFYYGRLQVEALDITNNTNTFPELIYAATDAFAFGSSAYYSPDDASRLGDLGFSTSVYGLSDDGIHVWAFQPSNDYLHHYVVPEPSSLALILMLGLVGGGMALRRGRG